VIASPTIIIVPFPVPVASRRGLDRDPDWHPQRERKSPPMWPLSHSIPSQDTRRLLDAARRAIAEARAQRLMQELAG
jgi:hypothetical protein